MAIYALALAVPSLPSSDGEPTLPWKPGVGAGTPYARVGVGGRRRLLESCPENYRVNDALACVACATGSVNDAGDDSSVSETHCTCPVDFRVQSLECVACVGGSTRAAGDNPLVDGDTACECATDERVVDGACSACPAGTTNVAGDDPLGGNTECTTSAANSLSVEGRNISSGNFHSCALLTDGQVKCWGKNSQGQLGNGNTTSSEPTPVEVSGITTATSIALGGDHSCALLANGTMKCWGRNANGQLGDGTTTDRTAPVDVSGITTATSFALGRAHTCAVLTNGTIFCWGANSQRQLGDPTTYQDRSTPFQQVSGITNAVSIALGSDHSCALLTDGKAMCWGYNAEGQLGRGGIETQDEAPGEVSGITSATSIAVGSWHSCAVLTGGTLKCWGYNSQGQLGNGGGTPTYTTSPIDVSGITTATSIALGFSHSCALLTDGRMMCWGDNLYGGLGGGTVPHGEYSPVFASDIMDATGMSLGYEFTCATLSDGTVKCWGSNMMGALGIGDLSDCQCTNAFEVSGLILASPPPPSSSNTTNVTSSPSSNTTNATSPPSSNTTNVPPPPPSPPPPSSNATAVPPSPPNPSPPPPPKSFVFLADYESSAGRVSSVLTALVVSLLSAL